MITTAPARTPPPVGANDLAFAFAQGLQRDTVLRLLAGRFTQSDYRQYLNTQHWQTKKAEALEFWGRACSLCECGIGLQIHHRPSGYRHLFREDPRRHLTVICSRCHRHHHRK